MRKPPVPWWSAECEKAKRERICAERTVKRNSTMFSKIRYNRSKAVCRRTFNDAKKKPREEFVSAINLKTPMKSVLEKISKINGKYRASPTTVLEENGRLISHPDQVANRIAQNFSTVGENMNKSEPYIRYKAQIESRPLRLEEDVIELYSAISLGELVGCLNTTNESSLTNDENTYNMLKNANDSFSRLHLRLYNRTVLEHVFPDK